MKTRPEILIDQITDSQKKIVNLEEEIEELKNTIKVAQANLRAYREENYDE